MHYDYETPLNNALDNIKRDFAQSQTLAVYAARHLRTDETVDASREGKLKVAEQAINGAIDILNETAQLDENATVRDFVQAMRSDETYATITAKTTENSPIRTFDVFLNAEMLEQLNQKPFAANDYE